MSTRHTILVVDDEPDVVKSVQDLLRLEYRVLGATRAKAAMEIMRDQEVHVNHDRPADTGNHRG